MELEIRKTADPTSGGLIIARDLDVSEALIQDLTIEEVKLLLEEYHRASPSKA